MAPPPLPGTIPAPAASPVETPAEPPPTTAAQAADMLQALRRAMTNQPNNPALGGASAPSIPMPPPTVQNTATPVQQGAAAPAAGAGTLPAPTGAIGQGQGNATGIQLPTTIAQSAALPPASNQIILKAEVMQFQGMSLTQFLEQYEGISGKTILRPYNLASTSEGLTLKAQSDWTLKEALFAMEQVLELNGIALVPVDDKFIRAVTTAAASAQPTPLSNDLMALGQSDQFVNQVVQVSSMLPSELAQLLATFTTTPNSITPFDINGTLVIRDHASSVRRMLEVVQKVDVMRESDYRVEVLPIKYGKVLDFYTVMQSLVSGQGATGTTAPRAGGANRGAARGLGAPTGLGAAGRGVVTPAIPAPAGNAQANFNQQALQALQNAQRALGVSSGQILEDARIVPDERNNKLVIYANKRDMDVITNLVSKLDVALAQVLIEAVIMQVQLGDSQTMGTSMIQHQRTFGKNSSIAGGINSGQMSLLGGLTNLAGALPSGFSYFGNINGDLDFAVQAIATDQSVNVLSRPRIQTSHAIPGSFLVSENIPFISGTADTFNGAGTVQRSTIERVDVGIQLNVTPYITPDGLVVMEIQQEANERGADVTIDNNPIPSVLRRVFSSTLTVRTGQAIMLGGYITDTKNKSKSGVPFLKDIPLFGALFRSSNQSSSRSELINLMQARVLDRPEDAALAAEEEKARLPAISEMERAQKQPANRGGASKP